MKYLVHPPPRVLKLVFRSQSMSENPQVQVMVVVVRLRVRESLFLENIFQPLAAAYGT